LAEIRMGDACVARATEKGEASLTPATTPIESRGSSAESNYENPVYYGGMMIGTILLSAVVMAQTAGYGARADVEDGIPVVVLTDRAARTEVRVVPTLGNRAYKMLVDGRDILFSPYKTLSEFKAQPAGLGVPFMAPWANRFEGDYFHANGRKYVLRPELENLRRDANRLPIHGLLYAAPEWEVASLKADSQGAEVVSRLEFWRYPGYMAQFPFAHDIQMTYRLSGGSLEVKTEIVNRSTETMPIAVGFHPYFQLPGSSRDSWRVTMPVSKKWLLTDLLVPTGKTEPWTTRVVERLGEGSLDDVFSGLEPGAGGTTEFKVEAGDLAISVVFGSLYQVAVVFAPAGKPFICFEPMTAVTNAFNLNHAGLYPELQKLAAGQTWRESFWIIPSTRKPSK
jgi:aldose 1-epimerase